MSRTFFCCHWTTWMLLVQRKRLCILCSRLRQCLHEARLVLCTFVFCQLRVPQVKVRQKVAKCTGVFFVLANYVSFSANFLMCPKPAIFRLDSSLCESDPVFRESSVSKVVPFVVDAAYLTNCPNLFSSVDGRRVFQRDRDRGLLWNIQLTARCNVMTIHEITKILQSSSSSSVASRFFLARCCLSRSRLPLYGEVEVDFVRRNRLPLHHLIF